MKKTYLELVLIAGLGLFLVSTIQVSAQQPLIKETLSGNVTEADISIDPAAPLPANGTITIRYRRSNRYRHDWISTCRGLRYYIK